jgi:NADPH-dependent curcumin reductase CurA
VLITGIGGGVSQFAAQFSVLGKAEVWVTSGDNHKIELAKKKMGITGGINYKTEVRLITKLGYVQFRNIDRNTIVHLGFNFNPIFHVAKKCVEAY